MVWLWLGRKGWAAEICPFLPVTDSLSACEALAAICCCINRQTSELEQLAHRPGLRPFPLLSIQTGNKTHGHFNLWIFLLLLFGMKLVKSKQRLIKEFWTNLWFSVYVFTLIFQLSVDFWFLKFLVNRKPSFLSLDSELREIFIPNVYMHDKKK